MHGKDQSIVETGQVRVNFQKDKITVKYIPDVDWLKCRENVALLK